MSSRFSLWCCCWWRQYRQHLSGKNVDGAMVVATLTGGTGGTVVEITATMGGAATAGVEIAGTTAGVGTAGEQVKAARGRTATLAGGMLDPTIVAGGTDRTITAGGTIDPTTDARAIGHATFAGGETSRFLLRAHNPLAAARANRAVRVTSWIVSSSQVNRSTNCATSVAVKQTVGCLG